MLNLPQTVERRRPMTMILGPIVLALLVFSGSLKTNQLIPALPIDLSILLAGLVVAFAAISMVTMGAPSRRVFYIPALWTLLLLSLIPYAGNTEYIETKTTNLLTITLVLALAPFFLLRHPRQRWWFIFGVVIVALVTAVGAVLNPAGDSERFLSEGSNPIDFGRAIGAGALVAIILALSRSPSGSSSGSTSESSARPSLGPWTRFALVLLGIIMLAGMLAAGSRGPSVGLVVALCAVCFLAPGFRGRRAVGVVTMSLLAGLAVFWLAMSGQGGFERILDSLAGAQGDVTNGRESLWGTATRLIVENPFGIGIGGFSEFANDSYPHNLVLEVFLEFGWITGIVLVLLAIVSLIRLARFATTPLLSIMFGLAIFGTVSALFSSDFNGNRLMWVTLVFAWTLGAGDVGLKSAVSRADVTVIGDATDTTGAAKPR